MIADSQFCTVFGMGRKTEVRTPASEFSPIYKIVRTLRYKQYNELIFCLGPVH